MPLKTPSMRGFTQERVDRLNGAVTVPVQNPAIKLAGTRHPFKFQTTRKENAAIASQAAHQAAKKTFNATKDGKTITLVEPKISLYEKKIEIFKRTTAAGKPLQMKVRYIASK